MRFGERVVVFILRPIYLKLFERPLWWFLTKVKAFFFAETSVHLENIERRLQAIEQLAARGDNGAQWDALEQLVLALFRQPELRILDPDWKVSTPQEPSVLRATDPDRGHGTDCIR